MACLETETKRVVVVPLITQFLPELIKLVWLQFLLATSDVKKS